MVIGFLCPLTDYGRGKAPLIFKLARDAGIDPVMSWRTTRGDVPFPFAVGIASVTPAQFSALGARSDVFVVDATNRSSLVSSIPAATRTKLQTIMSANGLSPGIQVSDTIQTAFTKLVNEVCPGTFGDVVAEFTANHGVQA
jgi:hypothetical protein